MDCIGYRAREGLPGFVLNHLDSGTSSEIVKTERDMKYSFPYRICGFNLPEDPSLLKYHCFHVYHDDSLQVLFLESVP